MSAGKSIAGLSKQIGQFFDATDQAKKALQKKGISSKSTNATALDRWAKIRQAADAEEAAEQAINNANVYGSSAEAKERARIAKEQIISLNTAHCNANSIAIAVGEDAQVTQAYSLGVVKSAAQVASEEKEKEDYTE